MSNRSTKPSRRVMGSHGLRQIDLFLPRPPVDVVSVQGRGFLVLADAMKFALRLRSEIADIIFIDPPFNLGKKYGVAQWLEKGDADSYEFYMKRLLREAVRVLKPGGALFLYHLPYWASRLSQELLGQLQFRHWIAIAMKNGFVRGQNLYPAHYALLYYTKGEPAHFTRPRLEPKVCRHCQKLVKDYGGYTSIVQQKGLNLSDFWDDLSPVRHKTRKHRRANQLPVVLTDRIVAIAGFPGGVLVDPFAGTGTSLVSALQAGMFFVANEMSRRSLRICMTRLLAMSQPRTRRIGHDSKRYHERE
ncbi:MAG: DNA-methyltransferase [Candidatus Binatia bacterium]